MKRSLILSLFSSAGVLALAGVMALAQDAAPSNGPRSDGQIEMDVVHALDGSEALKNDLITAATIQGEVTLSGTVSSEASKNLAQSIASKVPGGAKVNNHLKVGNPADAQNQQPAPDQGQADDSMDQANGAPANPPAYGTPNGN